MHKTIDPVPADDVTRQAPPSMHAADLNATGVYFYENCVPTFVAEELDQLYQNLHSSFLHDVLRHKASRASTYVVRRDGVAVVMLLLTFEARRIAVLNEMIDLSQPELDQFSRYMFARYPAVESISFSLIGKEIGRLHFPSHQHGGSEDIVLTLPASADAYLGALSAKMRRNIRYCLRLIARDNPTFRCETAYGKAINPHYLDELITLKKSNIDAKNLTFGIDDSELASMVQQAKQCGLVTVVLINEKVCGGSISLRVKDDFFGQIVCYDQDYKRYSLGILCTYLTICDQIALAGRESHLCWGRYPFKYKLGGVQRDRANLDIYRSRAAYCRNGGLVLARTVLTCLQRVKNRLLDMERGDDPVSRAGAGLIRVLRKIKRSRVLA